jgi:phage terminase large subunit
LKKRIDAILWPDEYIPFGGAAEFWGCQDPEVLICGGVGGGKTRCGLEMIHRDAERYPDSRQLLLRQTRKSLAQTALVDFETHVLPQDHPARKGGTREHRASYHYPNGSEIVLGGLDDPNKFMSGQYDRIYIVEMTDCRESDLELVGVRLRNFKMPFQQLAGDCNPNVPNHWVKQRCDRGEMRMIASTIKDNPLYWDGAK